MSSWRATPWAAEARTGSPRNKVVLLVLASCANHDFECFPSVAYIAHHAEISLNAVRRALRELCEKGLIERTKRSESNVRLTDLYRLLIPVSHPDAAPPSKMEGPPSKMEAEPKEVRKKDHTQGIELLGIGKSSTLSGEGKDLCQRAPPKRIGDSSTPGELTFEELTSEFDVAKPIEGKAELAAKQLTWRIETAEPRQGRQVTTKPIQSWRGYPIPPR